VPEVLPAPEVPPAPEVLSHPYSSFPHITMKLSYSRYAGLYFLAFVALIAGGDEFRMNLFTPG
jgi:hypothetical protein